VGEYSQHLAGQENHCPVCRATVKITETPGGDAGLTFQRGVCANDHRLRRILQFQHGWQVDPDAK
jgi:hypothetical protein